MRYHIDVVAGSVGGLSSSFRDGICAEAELPAWSSIEPSALSVFFSFFSAALCSLPKTDSYDGGGAAA